MIDYIFRITDYGLRMNDDVVHLQINPQSLVTGHWSLSIKSRVHHIVIDRTKAIAQSNESVQFKACQQLLLLQQYFFLRCPIESDIHLVALNAVAHPRVG